MTQFGLILKRLRTNAGLTQPALAEKAGISKGAIADLEQGRNSPTWESVQAIAAALGVSCEAFNESADSPVEPAGPGRPRKAGAGEPAEVVKPVTKRAGRKKGKQS